MTTTKTTKKISQTIETFLTQLKDVNDEHKLTLLAAVLDLLRFAASLTGNANPVPIANFVAAVRDFPWGQLGVFASQAVVPGSELRDIAQAQGVPAENVAAVLLRAFPEFLNMIEDGVLESDPELSSAQLLNAAVAAAAEVATHPRFTPLPEKPSTEIYTHKKLARVYTQKPVTPEMFEQFGMQYGTYRAPTGQQLRTIRFDSSPDAKLFLLETGETILESAESAPFQAFNRLEDFAKLPSTLLACTQLAIADGGCFRHLMPEPLLNAFTGAANMGWFSGCFGAFKHTVRSVVLTAGETHQLFAVDLDGDGKPATMSTAGLTETSLKFSVASPKVAFTENLSVVLFARQRAGDGVAITSALTRSGTPFGDVFLMRHDYPRHCVSGFYLFPLENGLVNLVVQI